MYYTAAHAKCKDGDMLHLHMNMIVAPIYSILKFYKTCL